MANTKYNHRIRAKNMNKIGGDEVTKQRGRAKIPQHGIAYPKDGSGDVILSSKSLEDLEKILKNGCWDHTLCPHKISIGTRVVVVPSAAVIAAHGDDAFGVVFEATSRAEMVEVGDEGDWPSE